MHHAIRTCQQELGSILNQLRALMLKYRNRERDKDLINAFDRFIDQEPHWTPNEDVILPDEMAKYDGIPAFWLSEPIEFAHYPNSEDMDQEPELADIVEKITAQPVEQEEAPVIKEAERREFTLDVEIQELIEADIDSHCDTFFAEAFMAQGKTKVFALDYYEQINDDLPEDLERLTCAKDVWLFSVLNFHSSMLPQDRKDFIIEPIGTHTYYAEGSNIGYGNLHLEDVSISRN